MMSMARALVVVVAVTLAGTALPGAAVGPRDPAVAGARLTQQAVGAPAVPSVRPVGSRRSARAQASASRPLSTVTIALDPGHQLGNHNFPRQTNALVPAGGFSKPCNSTGSATNGGVAEATVNMRLAKAVARRLRTLGAQVAMTRTTNSEQRWGPCVNVRGEFGERVGARLMVSLHADGAGPADHGFHVIAPTRRSPWTSDIATASLRLATSLRDGLTAGGISRSSYVGGGTGLDVRSDLGTLNMSDVPVAMVEIGNMRNAGDAHRMTSRSGRARYANALVKGIRTYLGR